MILTVNQLNEQSKALLESYFNQIQVSGEISRFTKNLSSKHCYFVIKDELSSINCIMFKFSSQNLKFEPKDGLKAIFSGRLSLYTPSGNYQFIVNKIEQLEIGDINKNFELLKEKLFNEGLFETSHKKSLPKFPKKIALITSIDSAAYNDIIKTAQTRFNLAQIDAYNCLMQGQNSAPNIIKILNSIDSKAYETIIIARGGGSKEDLQSFNEENLVRVAFRCKTPIISAIGHEIDFSILDFVSDKRSITPTAAIIDLLPNKIELNVHLDNLQNLANQKINSKIKSLDISLQNYINNLSYFSLKTRVSNIKTKILNLQSELNFTFQKRVQTQTLNLNSLKTLLAQKIKDKIRANQNRILNLQNILEEKEHFFKISQNLNQIFKDGKLINLNELKSSDEIEIVSQKTKLRAKIL